jgi:outer membrane protein OmpA-like peptidoglycan-associated protein
VGLGDAYRAVGKNVDAKRSYEKALELRPDFERAQNGLAFVQARIAREEAMGKALSTDGVMRSNDIIREVNSSSSAEGVSTMGPVGYTVVRARLRFPNIIFDGWSAKISRKESLQQLDEIGRALSSKELSGYGFWVEGHANSVGLDQRGGAAKLMKLSDERAEAVKKYLVRKFAIASNRISARGFGCSRPQFPNDSDEHREKNRRVEIVFWRQNAD